MRTIILLCAMTVGVVGVLFSMGIAEAWVGQMKTTAVHTFEGHLKVMGKGFNDHPVVEKSFEPDEAVFGFLRKDQRVKAWAERVVVQGLASVAGRSRVVKIVGIDPKEEVKISVMHEAVEEGLFLSAKSMNDILIGRRLAERMNLKLKKKVVLMSQQLSGEIGSGAFRVRAVFNTGNGIFDENTVYISKRAAQRMLGLGQRVCEVTVVLNQDRDLSVVLGGLREEVEGRSCEVFSWLERQPFVVDMIELMDQFMWIYYAVFYLAMAFGVLNTLFMAVGERSHEIGVLMALGMSRWRVLLMILLEAFFCAFVAAIVGVALGWGLVVYLGATGIDLTQFAEGMDLAGIGHVLFPFLRVGEIVKATAAMFVVSLLFAVFPAAKAAGLVPVEAINRA